MGKTTPKENIEIPADFLPKAPEHMRRSLYHQYTQNPNAQLQGKEFRNFLNSNNPFRSENEIDEFQESITTLWKPETVIE